MGFETLAEGRTLFLAKNFFSYCHLFYLIFKRHCLASSHPRLGSCAKMSCAMGELRSLLQFVGISRRLFPTGYSAQFAARIPIICEYLVSMWAQSHEYQFDRSEVHLPQTLRLLLIGTYLTIVDQCKFRTMNSLCLPIVTNEFNSEVCFRVEMVAS